MNVTDGPPVLFEDQYQRLFYAERLCGRAASGAHFKFLKTARNIIANSPSMIVPRHSESLGNALILHGRFEYHAVGELVDHGALDLLPRRLAGWKFEAAAALQGKAALRKFRLRDQHIGAALVEIDADAVAAAQQRKPAVRGCLGRGIEDRR